MIKRLFSWDFFVGVLFGIFLTIILLFLLYAKNMDSLIQDKESAREKEAILDSMIDYIGETEVMKEWNEKALIIEPENAK